MKKSILTAKTRRLILALSAGVILSLALGGVVPASNMGFKLNYGIVNAVNKLLQGSGVSVQVTDDNGPAKTLQLSIDPGETQNSNMGFKLNILSVPEGGILVEVPGGVQYVVTLSPDGNLIGTRL
jgi:hypothetical protein